MNHVAVVVRLTEFDSSRRPASFDDGQEIWSVLRVSEVETLVGVVSGGG